MARQRTHEEILDQMVYAVACVARHYGPGLSPSGLQGIRDGLNQGTWFCDAEWTSSVLEGGEDGNPDFCPQFLPPEFSGLSFNEVVEDSRR